VDIRVSLETEYIPEFNGNRSMSSGEQCVITHKVPTMALNEKLMPQPEMKFVFSTEGKPVGGEVTTKVDRKGLLMSMVTGIRNLTWTDSSGTHQIRNAEALFSDAPPYFNPLVEEIAGHLMSLFRRTVSEKNSE
jgi:hypothetical protein